ncbi:MAG: AraC family transcriptional regulator [Methylotenera sp.]|jgi:AraC-like DNA-binding protein|uniref:AraC family transcriptional regulator n=1 Tax=Methylotenera TaxID=359407 RepID=UPI00036FE5CF|nr:MULTISPECIES: AraC family transcriptional regulator [Methylotenera]MDP3777575.1 AraC family transcriptional regulator [Methylotenera sp.]PPC96344.1 MAG: AraC family transcriptional regulator [Methylotenera sp.]PPD00007.1 MAG: AraC family transcriptional regulator [Methylotenera sp.]
MTDRLAGFFRHYTFSARTFYTGNLCSQETFDKKGGTGHLHLLRKGRLKVKSPEHETVLVEEPALIFYPRPTVHSFLIDDREGVDLVCAFIELGGAAGNPLARALPGFILMPFREFPSLAGTLDLLFAEAFDSHCGRQTAIDCLTEYLLIQVLRHVMDDGSNQIGLLSGLADKRLAKALAAMHESPAHQWSLELLASTAGMSRARFAVHFRETIGMTPGDYLVQWRVGMVQEMLRRGLPINLIAHKVGYGSSSALSRAFRAQTGLSPSDWSKQAAD